MVPKAFVPYAALVLLAGCVDPILNRQLIVVQSVESGDENELEFAVDAAAIPADWIQERSVSEGPHGKEVHIRLRPGHRIKLMLVPVILPASVNPAEWRP